MEGYIKLSVFRRKIPTTSKVNLSFHFPVLKSHYEEQEFYVKSNIEEKIYLRSY